MTGIEHKGKFFKRVLLLQWLVLNLSVILIHLESLIIGSSLGCKLSERKKNLKKIIIKNNNCFSNQCALNTSTKIDGLHDSERLEAISKCFFIVSMRMEQDILCTERKGLLIANWRCIITRRWWFHQVTGEIFVTVSQVLPGDCWCVGLFRGVNLLISFVSADKLMQMGIPIVLHLIISSTR